MWTWRSCGARSQTRTCSRLAFRQKFVTEFRDRDVLFLMGTIHRFPKQWLIVSVLYPPKLPNALARQQSLF